MRLPVIDAHIWVGRAGHPLTEQAPDVWVCPVTGTRYRQVGPDQLVELTGDLL